MKDKKSRLLSFKLSGIIRSCKQLTNTKLLRGKKENILKERETRGGG